MRRVLIYVTILADAQLLEQLLKNSLPDSWLRGDRWSNAFDIFVILFDCDNPISSVELSRLIKPSIMILDQTFRGEVAKIQAASPKTKFMFGNHSNERVDWKVVESLSQIPIKPFGEWSLNFVRDAIKIMLK